MFDKLKRKNDDKAKRHPLKRWWMLITGVSIPLFIFGAALIFWSRPSAAPTTNFPTARLMYDSDNGTYTLDLNTGERTRIDAPTPTPGDPTPAATMTNFESGAENTRQRSQSYSPDNTWIAYWELVTEYYEWRLMYKSATGDYTRDLGVFIGGFSRLDWTVDGEWIVFSAYPEGVTAETFAQHTSELWMIHFETGELKRLTNNNFDDGDPAVSPDGTQIAYTASADGYNRLYIMDIATGDVRLLTRELHGYRATWSPDGRWIAFMTTSFDYSGDIWIIRADGTGAQAITTGTSREDNPAWVQY